MEVLSSKGKLRILKKLGEKGPSTKYLLRKYTGLKAKQLKRQLDELVQAGLVRQTSCKPKKYMINVENKFALKIVELLRFQPPPAPKRPPHFKRKKHR